MSEDDVRADVPSPDGDAGGSATSFGARLAAARERAGLSVGDVASRLRLHPNQVRALEAERLDALPEAAYVRGFVRGYARMVGIDATPLVDDLNRKTSPAGDSVVDGMARTQDYSPVRAAAHEQVSRVLVLGLAIVALIALGAVGWYAMRKQPVDPPVRAMKTVPPTPAQSRVAPKSTPAPTAGASEPAGAPERPAAVATVAVSEAPPTPPALLTLSFNGVSWVEVTDAQGKVLLSQLARAGEVHQPSGVAPLSVVIGDASKVAVSVRGAPMDLEPVTRSNVARFTVKSQ